MKISYIITVNPLFSLDYLELLIHSLNLQTSKDFDVVFYNQRNEAEKEILEKLNIKPAFPYRFYTIEKDHFFGEYPIWDLYGFHQYLIDNDLVGDYFMSLHMEEFLDVDYTEKAIQVLTNNSLDILLGNLSRTKLSPENLRELTNIKTSKEFSDELLNHELHKAIHWGFKYKSMFLTRNKNVFVNNFKKYKNFKWSNKLASNKKGFFKPAGYIIEDVYFMSKEFAREYDWFNAPMALYFEDIHINKRLGKVLSEITEFPAYFNLAKVYHLTHGKYYYQIIDDAFTEDFLKYETDNTILTTLKNSIIEYKNNGLDLDTALRLSRNNKNIGTQDINYRFHKDNILKKNPEISI